MTKFLMHKGTKITMTHQIFGKQTVLGPVEEVFNNNEQFGIVVAGHKLYCRKMDKSFEVHISENELIIADDLLKIHVNLLT